MSHPGHELLVYGWMRRAQPVVCVLTDGSGGDRASRLATTARVVAAAGAWPGPAFGRYTDAEFYARMLARDVDFFVGAAEELADFLQSIEATLVVGDAAEGYNTGHDVCRLLIDAAVALASRQTGRTIRNRALSLVGAPNRSLPGATHITLPRDVWREKIAAARNYPELAGEIANASARFGAEAFAVETLLPVEPFALPAGPAYYERYGAERIAAGKYPALIRRAEHLEAIARALRCRVQGVVPCAA